MGRNAVSFTVSEGIFRNGSERDLMEQELEIIQGAIGAVVYQN